MNIYIVVVGNWYNSNTDVCGVFSSIEKAEHQEAPSGWFIDHIEVWHLNGNYIRSFYPEESEEEE